MAIRIYDISPLTGTIATATPFTSPAIPIRGATGITLAFIATGGGSGTIALNHRFGEDALPAGSDKMGEGGTGHYQASEQAWGGASANTWAYSVLTPISANEHFLHGVYRARLVASTADVTGVTIKAIVRYDEGYAPNAMNGAIGSGQTVVAGNY